MEQKQKEKRIIFLKGQKTVLRPLKKDTDITTIVKWMNDQNVIQYLSRYLPMSVSEEERWFENLPNRVSDIVLAIETLDGILIGTIGLHDIHPKDRGATHGIVIGEKDYWGGGYGTDAGMTLFNYAFNTLNLRKIKSSVIGFNKRSLNYHLKCGYKIVGAHKNDIFKNGRYHDLILLELFKKDWQIAYKKYLKICS